MNLILCQVERDDGAMVLTRKPLGLKIPLPQLPESVPRNLLLSIRPEHLRAERGEATLPAASASLEATVDIVQPLGDEQILDLRLKDGMVVKMVAPLLLELAPDDEVVVEFALQAVSLFEAESGRRMETMLMGEPTEGKKEDRMRVIDGHAHLGFCCIFGLEVTAEELLAAMDKHKIDAAVVMPFPGAPDPIRVHNEIADLTQKHPGRIYGMVNLNPHCDRDEYESEVRRCVEGLGFVGVKLHTVGHAINPLSADASKVFELARELEIPIMVHSGSGTPFSPFPLPAQSPGVP